MCSIYIIWLGKKASCCISATLLPCFPWWDDLIFLVKRNNPMKRYLAAITSIIALILLSAPDLWAAQAKPHISDLMLHQGESDVLLSAQLVTELGDEMREALTGGVPLTFSYSIRLTTRGSILGEKIIRRREVVHSLEFDPVKQLYMFTGEGYGMEDVVKTTKDEDLALMWLTNILDWRLYPLKRLC